MEESVTYQAIIQRGLQDRLERGLHQGIQQGVQQGAISEAQRLLLIAGQAKLGPPSTAVKAAVGAINDTGRIESLVARIYTTSTWDELLKS